MWAVVANGRMMDPDGLVKNASIIGELNKRWMVDPSRPVEINSYLRRKRVHCGCES